MKRETCLRCAEKHLAQARALLLETRKGYRLHVIYAMGHMAEAEDELALEHPQLIPRIKKQRGILEVDHKHMPDFPAMLNAIHRADLRETRAIFKARAKSRKRIYPILIDKGGMNWIEEAKDPKAYSPRTRKGFYMGRFRGEEKL